MHAEDNRCRPTSTGINWTEKQSHSVLGLSSTPYMYTLEHHHWPYLASLNQDNFCSISDTKAGKLYLAIPSSQLHFTIAFSETFWRKVLSTNSLPPATFNSRGSEKDRWRHSWSTNTPSSACFESKGQFQVIAFNNGLKFLLLSNFSAENLFRGYISLILHWSSRFGSPTVSPAFSNPHPQCITAPAHISSDFPLHDLATNFNIDMTPSSWHRCWCPGSQTISVVNDAPECPANKSRGCAFASFYCSSRYVLDHHCRWKCSTQLLVATMDTMTFLTA